MKKSNFKIKLLKYLSFFALIFTGSQSTAMAAVLRASRTTVQTVPLNFLELRTKDKIYIICMTTGKYLVAEQILSGNVLIAIKFSKIAYDLATADDFNQALQEVAVDEVTNILIASMGKLFDRIQKDEKSATKSKEFPKLTAEEKEKINKQIESLQVQIIQRQLEVAKTTKAPVISAEEIDDLIDQNSKNNVIFKEGLALAKQITLKAMFHALDLNEMGLGYRLFLNTIILPGVSGLILDNLVKQINEIYFHPSGIPKLISKLSPEDQLIIKSQIKENIVNFAASCTELKRSHLLNLLQAMQEGSHGFDLEFLSRKSFSSALAPNKDLENLLNKIKDKKFKTKSIDQSKVLSSAAAKEFARLVAICERDEYSTLTEKIQAQIEAKNIVKKYTSTYDPNYSMEIFNFYHSNNKFLLNDKLIKPAPKLFEDIVDLPAGTSTKQEVIFKDLYIANPCHLINPLAQRKESLKLKSKQSQILFQPLKIVFGFDYIKPATTLDYKRTQENSRTESHESPPVSEQQVKVKTNVFEKPDFAAFRQHLETGQKKHSVQLPVPNPLADLILQNRLTNIKNKDFEKEYYSQLFITANATLRENVTTFENMSIEDQAKLLDYYNQHYKKDFLDREQLTPEMKKNFTSIHMLGDEERADIYYKAAHKNISVALKNMPDIASLINREKIIEALQKTGHKAFESTKFSVKQLTDDIRTRKIFKNFAYGAAEQLGTIFLVYYLNIKNKLSVLSPREQYLYARICYDASKFVTTIFNDPTELGNLIGPAITSFTGRKAIGFLLPVASKGTTLLKDSALKIIDPTNSLYKQSYIKAILDGSGIASITKINSASRAFWEYLCRFDFSTMREKDIGKILNYLAASYIMNTSTKTLMQPIIMPQMEGVVSTKITLHLPTDTSIAELPKAQTFFALEQMRLKELYREFVLKHSFAPKTKSLIKFDVTAYDPSFDRTKYYSKIVPTHPNFDPNYKLESITKPTFGFEFADFELRDKEKIIPSIINLMIDWNKSTEAVRKAHQTFLEQEKIIQKDPELAMHQEGAIKYVIYLLGQAALETDHAHRLQAIFKLNQFIIWGKGHIPYTKIVDKLNSIYFTKEGLIRDYDDISYKEKQEISSLIAKFYKYIATNKEQYIKMLQSGADIGAVDFATIIASEKDKAFSMIEDEITWSEVLNHFLNGSKSSGISERILNNPANKKMITLIYYLSNNHLDTKVNTIEFVHKARQLCNELDTSADTTTSLDQAYICKNLLHHYELRTFIPFYPIAKEFAHDPLWTKLSQAEKTTTCSDLHKLTNLHKQLLDRYHKVIFLEELFNIPQGAYNDFLYKAIDSVDMLNRVNYEELFTKILDYSKTKTTTEGTKIIETFFAVSGLLKPLQVRLDQINIKLPAIKDWSNINYLKNINNLMAAHHYPTTMKELIKKTLDYYVASENESDIEVAKIYAQLAELTKKEKSRLFVFGQKFVRSYSNPAQIKAHKSLLHVLSRIGAQLNLPIVESRKVKINYVLSLANIALRNLDLEKVDTATSIINNIDRILIRDTEDTQSLLALTNIFHKYGFESNSLQLGSLINYLAVTGLSDIKPIMLRSANLTAQANAIAISASYGDDYVSEAQKLIHEELIQVSDKCWKFLVLAEKNQCPVNNSYAVLVDLLSRDCRAIDKLNRDGLTEQAQDLLKRMHDKFNLASHPTAKLKWLDNILLQDGSGSVPVYKNKGNLVPIHTPEPPEDEETRRVRVEAEEQLLVEKHKYEIEKLKADVEKMPELLAYQEVFVKHDISGEYFKKITEDICWMFSNQEDVFELFKQIHNGYKYKTTIIAKGLPRPFKFKVEHFLIAQRKPNGKFGGWHHDFGDRFKKNGRMKSKILIKHPNGYHYVEFQCPITKKIKGSSLFNSEENIVTNLQKIEKILGSYDFSNKPVNWMGIHEAKIRLDDGYILVATVNIATAEVTTWYISHPDFDALRLNK